MKMPEGIPNPGIKVCRLTKSLYGLKQASRQWFAKLHGELQKQGFVQSKNDYSLFIKRDSTYITLAAVYVDDILLIGNHVPTINSLKKHLDAVFSIKDLGVMSYFLGIEVGYLPDGVVLTQKKFTKSLLADCGFDLTKFAVTPLPINTKLLAEEGSLYDKPELYRTLVGKLNFLTHTRPDLSFAVQLLSQFMHQPRDSHVAALTHVLRYVSHTAGQGILLQAADSLTLQAFSDSDWAACPNTRKSVTGYVLLFGNSPVSWKSKKQSTISRSSSEAEYRAMAAAASEVTWLVRLLEEFAIYIAKNPVFHERTKHIEIDCHFTRDKVLEGLLQLTYLPTHSQLADVFTKALPSPQLHDLLSKLGVSPATPSLRGGVGQYDVDFIKSTQQQDARQSHHPNAGLAHSRSHPILAAQLIAATKLHQCSSFQ
ncbi:uncharacterized mitochondrial protein AtMg00810-like [Spinacia oleracea]|uniref:Uncharacterized mitochondrial protein AtMg00810-like n=1 Tax=Spinacia oleracea TaxID=3562 RepID=A0ABM3QZM9_SPIOL|nr:uncharacterized mitochondrial protein AtMg00810-like [Spinacia oleracea]